MDRNTVHKCLIEVAAKSPAIKRKVGAIICQVKYDETPNMITDYTILATGFNYNMSDPLGQCEDEQGNTLDTVIHAECSAINDLNSYRSHNTINCEELIMFVTHPPCDGCKAALLSEGIKYEVIGDFLKFDNNKPRVALVPSSLVLGVAKVLTFGAKKYKVNNWRRTPDIESYISALERHILAWKAGEDNDPESGLHHLEHAACNIAFIIELKDLPRVKKEV